MVQQADTYFTILNTLLFSTEGVGFEPTTPLTQGKRLAGARTRPLCDPSTFAQTILFYVKVRVFTML